MSSRDRIDVEMSPDYDARRLLCSFQAMMEQAGD
jgi:hypothetical protein